MLVNLHIVNVKSWIKKPVNVYIGRMSKGGNPYRISGVHSRENVVELYEQYIKTWCILLRDIHQLRGKNLGCLRRASMVGRMLEPQLQSEQPEVCRLVMVKNIGPTVTGADISKLFHFHRT